MPFISAHFTFFSEIRRIMLRCKAVRINEIMFCIYEQTLIKLEYYSWACWHTVVISESGRLKQGDCKFKASLNYKWNTVSNFKNLVIMWEKETHKIWVALYMFVSPMWHTLPQFLNYFLYSWFMGVCSLCMVWSRGWDSFDFLGITICRSNLSWSTSN